jgi:hypothetical protein
VFGLALLAAELLTGGLWKTQTLPTISRHLDSTVGAATAVLLSIPVGFVIYQVYYVLFDEPRLLSRLWIPEDRGATVLRRLEPDQLAVIARSYGGELDLDSDKIVEGYRRLGLWRADDTSKASIEKYAEARATNWRVVVWMLATQVRTRSRDRLRDEYTTLSDIYHALGACRTAVFLAAMFYAGFNAYKHHDAVFSRPIRVGVTLALLAGLCLACSSCCTVPATIRN